MTTKIMICMGTSGISAGAEEVARLFEREIEKNNLAGKCKVVRTGDRGLFRDVLVDVIEPGAERITYEYIAPEHVAEIFAEHIIGGKPVARRVAGDDYKRFFEGQTRIVLANCGEIDPESIDEYIASGGWEALKKAVKMKPQEIIDEVKAAGLRGRGGGGFSTGMKWQFTADAQGEEKFVICNADEGDPGAFMDRSVLEGDPNAVLEGMVVAGYAVGSTRGFIYCRAEYPLAIKRLNIAIEQAREKGFLGKDICGGGFDFDITIAQGAGAFVCGEETALLASIEGKRGSPRVRPPFPALKGLWQMPTLLNNVETYANVPHIINKGSDWYAATGTEDSKGTKVFALAGKVKNTGLVEVPMGATIREIVEGAGGGMENKKIPFKAVQMGGPSGGCIPSQYLDLAIDYASIAETGAIMGSGGLIVMDAETCMVDVARYFLSFTVEESCGKCVPCRVGLKRMLEVLEEIVAGRGKPEHIDFLEELSETIGATSLCGLGATAPNPVLTTLKYFRDEYTSHIEDKYCTAHTCPALCKFEVVADKCVKCGACAGACPAGAIEWEKGGVASINREKCTKCMSCYKACNFGAII